MTHHTPGIGWNEAISLGQAPASGHRTRRVETIEKPLLFPGEHEVHLWRIPLDVSGNELERRTSWLSREERRRASRFRFDLDRRRYLAHRGALRWVLSEYLSVEPGQVRFDRDPQGKPYLTGGLGAGLQFSVSHSGCLGLYALRRGLPVGVDIERTVPGFEWMEVASTTFSRRELDQLGGLPDDQRLEVFFAIWTRKEAVAKALGLGLRAELASLEVPSALTSAGWSRCCPQGEGSRTEVSLVDLSLGAGFRGALALVGDGAEVLGFEYAAPDGTHPDDLPSLPDSSRHWHVLGAPSAGDVQNGIELAP